ncbi:L-2-amino-thiazoline-4-carboxylic acid hydrolase [Konateibacter massiliensis]|uniref:L-2-amino-thiazoline-4-carboxylic acid hydrolase n=1 Tax=Konateibacter massiliensis TaxID=2002841 RepID=UPI000C14B3A8|nr:L-2-amino-thiazoline-4-carboxylic acid hydrolase [Konateibacter massiliensis]
MDESLLAFDREKHICYSNLAKRVMLEHLSMHYPKSEVDYVWEKVQQQYVEFLKDVPYLGGIKNTHNGTGGTYDCIALFAYYEAQENKPTLDELYEMNIELLRPSFEQLGKFVNANNKILLRVMNFAFKATARSDKKHAKDWHGDYIMEVEPYNKQTGIHYYFSRCPIAEFARQHGYLHLMPAICNGDYPIFEAMHAGLIRKTTCSNGSRCDYWIVGDKSRFLKEHPRRTDTDGYWYND